MVLTVLLKPSLNSQTMIKTPVKTTEAIIEVLSREPNFTLVQVAETIGKSISAVERATKKLTVAGKLKFVGPKKGGHWEVLRQE